MVVDAVDPEGKFINFLNLQGRLIGPDMKSYSLQLEQTAPGRYEADFPARQVGTYTVNVVQKAGKENLSQTCSVTIPYPPEYKDIQTNRGLLDRLALMTGGKVMPKPQEVFKPDAKKARIPTDLWWIFTLIGILLFPLDVAIRRLAIDFSEMSELIMKGVQAVRSNAARPAHLGAEKEVESVGRLLGAKKSRQKDEGLPEWAKPEPVTQPAQEKPEKKPETPTSKEDTPKSNPMPPADTTSRLLEAKRRARDKFKE